jgi:hypothetical protein
MMDSDDEIARLATECLVLGRCECNELIEARVARAVQIGTWDEINKWQRVKLRVMRLQRQRELAAGNLRWAG